VSRSTRLTPDAKNGGWGDVCEVRWGILVQRAAPAAAGGVAVRREVSERVRKGYGGELG
jgi:hypothetical protein